MVEEKNDVQSSTPDGADAKLISNPELIEASDLDLMGEKIPEGFTVKQKLLIAIGMIGVTLLAVTGTGYWSIASISPEFESLTNESIAEARAIGQLTQSILTLLNETREYSIEPSEATLDQINRASDNLIIALENYQALNETQQGSNEQSSVDGFLESIQKGVNELQIRSKNVIDLLVANVSDEQLEEALEALEEAEISLEKQLDEADQGLNVEVTEKVYDIEERINQTEWLLILLPLVAFSIFLALFYLLNQSIVNRLKSLENVTQRISTGELNLSAQVDSGDEIGLLAHTFNIMTKRLRESLGDLEKRVVERTYQLETVVEVSQKLSSILDLSDLMHEVVYLTRETFDYYHVHIYLLDEWGETLDMVEGYGEAGAEMKRRGHSILLRAPKSLVARAAREGKILNVNDVRQNSEWLPNPLLPETRSEAAVPIYLGSEIVGVLDVQSEKIAGITPESERILRALASQVATAVGNARLFAKTQTALKRAEHLQSLYTGDAWQRLTKNTPSNFEISRSSALPPLPEKFTREAEMALQQRQTVNLKLDSANDKNNEEDKKESSYSVAHHVVTPLKLRNQVIGILGLQDNNPDRQWTTEEIALIEAISEQMSLAIENARLFEETGRRASRERIIADVTQQVWSADEIEAVMRTAVTQLGEKLQASEVVIRLDAGAKPGSF
ncbi:MAG: GAF domain-containing protein [Anaerolineae bacterium]|nr:GAF domain-containing protein [Anaerolineae bacterium]